MAGYAVKGIAWGVRIGRLSYMLAGVAAGVRACVRAGGMRRPISRATFRFDQRARAMARAGSAVPLSEADAALRPLGPRAKQADGGWRGPARSLYRPLRHARTRLLAKLGRPIHCEVCG